MIVSTTAPGSSGNLVLNNFIGTDVTGLVAVGNQQDGVSIVDSSGNTIGGLPSSTPANLISGNLQNGVSIIGTAAGLSATNNVVFGNFIGTTLNGTVGLGNQANGVSISDASNNTVGGTISFGGGTSFGAGNLISGNTQNGVLIQGTGVAAATGNVIDAQLDRHESRSELGPGQRGRRCHDPGRSSNTVGGTVGNVISGNTGDGVYIAGTSTLAATGNLVINNLIGTDGFGQTAIPNQNGVQIFDASSNTIGGTATGSANTISGNSIHGVFLQSDGAAPTSSNLIEGNQIGTQPSGNLGLGNGTEGVGLQGAVGNFIGGTGAAGNLISANQGAGVGIFGGSNNNTVQGNRIGTDVDGQHRPGQRRRRCGHRRVHRQPDRRHRDGDRQPDLRQHGRRCEYLQRGHRQYASRATTSAPCQAAPVRWVTTTSASSSPRPLNTIGGTHFAARNIIAGNASNGVALDGSE